VRDAWVECHVGRRTFRNTRGVREVGATGSLKKSRTNTGSGQCIKKARVQLRRRVDYLYLTTGFRFLVVRGSGLNARSGRKGKKTRGARAASAAINSEFSAES